MKTYKVDGFSGWFLVNARTKRLAKSEGVKEYGRGNVLGVSVATKQDVDYYLSVKGYIGEA